MLDPNVGPQTPSIDIVNYFLTAIRATAPYASMGSVGTSATVSVMPLKLIARAPDTGEAEFAFRPDGKLADGYISFTWVAKDLPSVTMISREQVPVVFTEGPPPPDSFIG